VVEVDVRQQQRPRSLAAERVQQRLHARLRARVDQRGDLDHRRRRVAVDSRQTAHLDRHLHRDLPQVAVAPAGEHLQRLFDLQRIADRAAEGVVHRGHQGDCPAARTLADLDHLASQLDRAQHVRHERAASGLDVEDDSVSPGG